MSLQDNDVIRVTAKMSRASSLGEIQNVYHIRYDGSSVSYETLWDAVATWLDDAYGNIVDEIHPNVHFDTIEMFNVTQDEPVGEDAWPTLTAGTGASDMLPAQTSPLVLFPTNTARSQGRKFLPPVGEESQSNGVLLAGVLTSMANYAADLLENIPVGVWSAAVGNYNPTLARFAPWISAIVKDVLRTQRRRVAGVGT